MRMEIIHYAGENLEGILKDGITIIDFYAKWCGPCNRLAEDLEELASERKEGKILKINVDEYDEVAQKYGVMSIPSIFVYKDGEEISHFIGYKDKEEILEIIEK